MDTGDWERSLCLAHSVHQTNTPDTTFLPALVLLFRAVDANTHNLPCILDHNTFFRALPAVNRLPIAAGESVRVEEFLYTTPHPYEC